ncbi:hypothetical protein HDC30_002473 [Pseudomonas sp. JAI115]|nr:hypothetical protein [Pseudomonas sp. JAI115]
MSDTLNPLGLASPPSADVFCSPLPVLSVFDFDGTLTRHDSFIPFLWFACGTPRFCLNMLKLAGPSLGFVCGRLSRDQLKAQLVSTFLTGVSVQWVREQASAFCQARWPRLMRPAGVRRWPPSCSPGPGLPCARHRPAWFCKRSPIDWGSS